MVSLCELSVCSPKWRTGDSYGHPVSRKNHPLFELYVCLRCICTVRPPNPQWASSASSLVFSSHPSRMVTPHQTSKVERRLKAATSSSSTDRLGPNVRLTSLHLSLVLPSSMTIMLIRFSRLGRIVYSSVQFIHDQVHGVTGSGIGAFMIIPGTGYEASSGGPFFRWVVHLACLSILYSTKMDS